MSHTHSFSHTHNPSVKHTFLQSDTDCSARDGQCVCLGCGGAELWECVCYTVCDILLQSRCLSRLRVLFLCLLFSLFPSLSLAHAHNRKVRAEATGTHSTRCNTLQHTAPHCNTLQHTAIHCNTHDRKVRAAATATRQTSRTQTPTQPHYIHTTPLNALHTHAHTHTMPCNTHRNTPRSMQA